MKTNSILTTVTVLSLMTSLALASEPNTPQRAASRSLVMYVVRSGDTLGGIAWSHGIRTQVLASMNHLRDANLILPGQHLKMPAPDTAALKPKPAAKPQARAEVAAGQAKKAPEAPRPKVTSSLPPPAPGAQGTVIYAPAKPVSQAQAGTPYVPMRP